MAVLACCGGTAFAQSEMDAFRYTQTELNGTARQVAPLARWAETSP